MKLEGDNPIFENMMMMNRRQFFGKGAAGIGTVGLASTLNPALFAASAANAATSDGGGPLFPNFAPKAKRVIYLFMSGAPSQMDTFDYKPKMQEMYDKDLPEHVSRGQRKTTMTSGQSRFPIAPSIYKFKKYENNQDGVYISELMPHTAGIAKDICLIRSMWTEAINHDPAITYIQTGAQIPGRPSVGAWLSYGLSTMNRDLPNFVVLNAYWSGRQDAQALYNRLWGSGFLPSEHQGVMLRSQGDPVLYLSDPAGVSREDRRRMLDRVAAINERLHGEMGDPETLARIKQGEMAYRMQASVPELTDISNEPQHVLDMYGPEVNKPGSFAACSLLARRLIERDVRCVQIYHRGWDQHGNLPGDLPKQCNDVDQPSAALVKDLKQRGLLEDTLVIWGGEFGRTIYCQGGLSKTNYGRDHHPRCFSIWMAGAGVKPGIVYGHTDDFSYNITQPDGKTVIEPSKHEFTPGAVHVHDLNATMLHLLGVDHERLTYRYQGREFRLTDVHGHVVNDILV